MTASSDKRIFLVVDDEPDILDALKRLFRREYRVLTATSAAEALEIVEREPVQVVMSDQRMPGVSGVELLGQLHERRPEIVRVLFTGYSNIGDVIDAINRGQVYRYINKPWKPAELRLFVAQAFEHYQSRLERQALMSQLRQVNQQMQDQLEQLRRANEELKTLDQVKNVFMEVVSHELNTPIAIILGYVFLLNKEFDSDLGELANKALSGIDSSANRLKNISHRIFQMLADEGPTATLNLEWISLEEFGEDLRAQLLPFLVKRGQELLVEISDEVREVHADREKLGDILLNLLMNAIKFSRDGQQIKLKIAAAADDLESVIFSVEDQGIGISEADVAQIFDAFFSTFESQHHSSGSFEFGKRGIGLGLPVARRFIEMHGGTIEVESTKSKGSRFIVSLPRDPALIDGLVDSMTFDISSSTVL